MFYKSFVYVYVIGTPSNPFQIILSVLICVG